MIGSGPRPLTVAALAYAAFRDRVLRPLSAVLGDAVCAVLAADRAGDHADVAAVREVIRALLLYHFYIIGILGGCGGVGGR
jgi:hypothetical protein